MVESTKTKVKFKLSNHWSNVYLDSTGIVIESESCVASTNVFIVYFTLKNGELEVLRGSRVERVDGEGLVSFPVSGPGVYEIENYLYSYPNLGQLLMVVTMETAHLYWRNDEKELRAAAELAEFKRLNELTELEKKLEDHARKIIFEIDKNKNSYKPVKDGNIVAVPEFAEPPTLDSIIKNIKVEGQILNHLDDYLNLYSVPRHYVINRPVYAKASSAEEAISEVREKLTARAAEAEKADQVKEEMGLCELKGSPKQIAWANKIRSEFAEKNPEDSRLKRCIRAKLHIPEQTGH